MAITKVKLENFTTFERLDMEPSEGINVLIGANGTGKTHIIKLIYSACDISKTRLNFADKLIRNFLPSGRALGRLVKRSKAKTKCSIEVYRGSLKLKMSFSKLTKIPSSARVTGLDSWQKKPIESVYIPVKEMLANAPGFRSLYSQREIHFEEIYVDILDRAYRPILRQPLEKDKEKLISQLSKLIEGKVSIDKEEFFFRSNLGTKLEFTLLAEGLRKIGLLMLLIQNGTLKNGSVLFWDEPETNLNPKFYGPVIDVLLQLQRMGVQIFVATHDYVVMKELDLRKTKRDKIKYYSLYTNKKTKQIECHSTQNYLEIHPNAIAETFTDLYNREIKRSLGGIY